MTKIAVLGLGAMGSRMAARLLAAGHAVTVYNRSPDAGASLIEAGAIAAPSPREAAREAELVLAVVRDDEASRAIWTDAERGALLGMRPGAVAVEASTLTPAWITALAERASAAGIELLDAPVVGSRPQAEAGALISLVGGARALLDRVRDELGAFAATIHHVGPTGAGARAKLAVNALFGVQVAAVAELLATLERGGLARAAAAELLAQLPVASPATKAVAAQIAAGNYAPLFPIELVEKDLDYLLAEAERLDTQAPLSVAARAVFGEALARGYGADNIAGVARLYFSATM